MLQIYRINTIAIVFMAAFFAVGCIAEDVAVDTPETTTIQHELPGQDLRCATAARAAAARCQASSRDADRCAALARQTYDRCDDSGGLSCATVLCPQDHHCEENCAGQPVCLPQTCEGFTGLECPDDFQCLKRSTAPDHGGRCVKDCAPTCGECISDDGCARGESCTASVECLSWCSCPQCDVCAGHCVPEEMSRHR